jgi:signal peptidase II
MTPSRTLRLLTVLVVLICTAGCDQAAKHLARAGLSPFQSTNLAGGFVELTLAENPGAFLSLGGTLPEPVRGGLLTVGIGAGLICLAGYLVGRARLGWLSFLSLALVWAGGMSNLIDRFARHGRVTDFIVIRAGPFHTGIFNFADLAIVIGTVLLFGSLSWWKNTSPTARVARSVGPRPEA